MNAFPSRRAEALRSNQAVNCPRLHTEHYLYDLLSFIAGCVFTLAFSPFERSYAAIPALALFFALIGNLSPQRAAMRGYWFGLGQFGLGVSWVYYSVHDYGGGGLWGALAIVGLFVGFWSLFPALAGYLMVKLSAGADRLLIAPLVWILIEYLRGRIVLEGFPWLQTGYSQIDTPLGAYIPLIGGYGTGMITALLSSVLTGLFCLPHARIVMLLLVIVLWCGGIGLKNIVWTYPIDQPLKVTLIQGNIRQDRKWLPETRIGTIIQYISMTEAHWDSKIIVWPESAVPAYLSDVYESYLKPLNHSAKAHRSAIVVSVPSYGTADGQKYNSVITLGQHEGIYRKVHLLPFGEYMPWQPVSGWVLAHFNLRLSQFTSGDPGQPLLKAGGYPFITSICYEDAFAENALRGLADAAFLVNATNDAWFGDSIEPHQHLQIARMRAKETGRYLLRATNTGVTAIVSPQGRIISQAPLFTQTALSGMVQPMRGLTPFAKLGDKPVIGGILFMLVLLIVRGKSFKINSLLNKPNSIR